MIYDHTEKISAGKRLGKRGQSASGLLQDAAEGATVRTDSKTISTHHADRGWEDAPGHAPHFPLVKTAGGGCRSALDLRLALLLSCSRVLPRVLLWMLLSRQCFRNARRCLKKGGSFARARDLRSYLRELCTPEQSACSCHEPRPNRPPISRKSSLFNVLYGRRVLRPTGSVQQRLPPGPSKRLRCRYSRPLNDRQKSIGRLAREPHLGLPFLRMNAPRETQIADSLGDSKSKGNRNEPSGW